MTKLEAEEARRKHPLWWRRGRRAGALQDNLSLSRSQRSQQKSQGLGPPSSPPQHPRFDGSRSQALLLQGPDTHQRQRLHYQRGLECWNISDPMKLGPV